MPFRGHLEYDDPRGNLWVAGGATWPTMPPYRWRAGCQTANLSWHFLQDPGVLMEPWLPMLHDSATWTSTDGIPPFTCNMTLTRTYTPILHRVLWWLRVEWPDPVGVLNWVETRSVGPANVNLTLGPLQWELAPPGINGKSVTFFQVKHDKENPPGGWPPW